MAVWPRIVISTGSAEKAATVSLSEILRLNPDMKKEEAVGHCVARGVSERRAKSHVWFDARVAAGLEGKARPGRKKRTEKS